jgi:hypothetical protein
MIAGHFGFALAVKARAPRVPAAALLFATQWLDVVFAPLFAAGIETISSVPGTAGGYGQSIIHADYTHSLAGALLLSSLFGIGAGLRWGCHGGVTLGSVAFSHWLLDLIVHRADLPLLPGGAGGFGRLGFGLWRAPAAAALLELLLVLLGAILYWRAGLACTRAASAKPARAHLAGGAALITGVVTLAIDVAGY